ncbi:NAD-dependent epimerase/dehydratase family protein [Ramlibacter sp.]|uniref:NAD-dependent epimerase/dehydratase family protein n=1 Tax=Ramlibacter sp. TaxID=1917967 RepID=UPI00260E62C3|nr:NAD-dependent epimerase/dehydratase family protein [Ramlibacter sp.]MDB5957141.1 NAD-dependent epimerase/dehydratase [Ramlibacter sp.]
MIVGNGLLANAFRRFYEEAEDVVVYASGVSNSREMRGEEFLRERRLLEQFVDRPALLLYFSTCSINDEELAGTPYVTHKKAMEELVRGSPRFAIFRLPQVVGRTRNPNTLTNYLYGKVSTGEPFEAWTQARRNLIDVDDVACIVRKLLQDGGGEGRITEIASPFYTSIPELVRVFEAVLGRGACYTRREAGGSYPIDTSIAVAVAAACGVRFDSTYVRRVIEKYYGSDAS